MRARNRDITFMVRGVKGEWSQQNKSNRKQNYRLHSDRISNTKEQLWTTYQTNWCIINKQIYARLKLQSQFAVMCIKLVQGGKKYLNT